MASIFNAEYLSGIARADLHHHNEYEIIYITDGTLEIEIGTKNYIAKSGSVILITNLETHVIHNASADYKRYCITLCPTMFDARIHNPALLSMLKNHTSEFVHCVNMESVSKPLTQLFAKCLMLDANNPYYEELVVCYITELLAIIATAHPNTFVSDEIPCRKTVLEIQHYIDMNFGEDLKIADISKQFCISSFYLTHKFKEITGFSPKQYLTSVRLKNAEYLLHHTKKPISELAIECGFADVGNFIRNFKNHYGYSPGKLRTDKKF